MRRELVVRVLEYTGSNYEIGLQQGKGMEKNGMYQFLQAITADTDPNIIQSILENISPTFLVEIKGLAEGLGIDYSMALKMYSGYNLTFPPMGCTAFSQEKFYVRNYDFSPDLYDGNLVFNRPEEGFASVGFAQQMVGRLDGMNECGLVIGLHLVNETNQGEGLIGTTIVRLVLDLCRNVEEAIDMLTNLPHGHCYNYSLMDREGNKCLVEASPDKQVVYHEKTLMCTNYFQSDDLKDKNRANVQGSLHRKKILQELTTESITPEEAYHIFNNEDSALFFTDYQNFFGTLHTVVYIPETLELLVGVGGDFAPVRLSLKSWLRGEQEISSELVGKIKY